MVSMPSWYAGVAMLLARVLVGGFFLYVGITQLTNVDGIQGYLGMLNLPAPSILVWLVIAVHIIPGAMIIVGYQTKIAALILALFTLLTIPIAHSNWSDQMQMMMALKNLAIAGGLFCMSVHGSGAWSLDTRRVATIPTF